MRTRRAIRKLLKEGFEVRSGEVLIRANGTGFSVYQDADSPPEECNRRKDAIRLFAYLRRQARGNKPEGESFDTAAAKAKKETESAAAKVSTTVKKKKKK